MMEIFLKKLKLLFQNSSNNKLAKHVGEEENLDRFLFSKSYYSKQKQLVKYSAFMPNPKNGEVSVFRVTGLSNEDQWKLANFVETQRNTKAKAIASLKASDVFNQKVNVVPETTSHSRHANIINFPDEKPKQQAIATELALKATLLLPVPQPS